MEDETDKREEDIDKPQPSQDLPHFEQFEPSLYDLDDRDEDLDQQDEKVRILKELGAKFDTIKLKSIEARQDLKENIDLRGNYLYFEGEKVNTKNNTYQKAFSNNLSRKIRFKNLIERLEELESGEKGSDIESDNDDENIIATKGRKYDFVFENEWMDDDDFRGEYFKLTENYILDERVSHVVDLNDYETLDEQIRARVKEVFSDNNIEKYRDEIEKLSDEEKKTSRWIEILDKYKEDVNFFNELIERARDSDQDIELFKKVRDIRQGDVDLLTMMIDNRLENPKFYLQKSKALQLLSRVKSLKIWFDKNAGPSLAIVVSIVSGVSSIIIYCLEFIEKSKKKIDKIRNDIQKILDKISSHSQQESIDHISEIKAIEQADKNTFRKTLLEIEKIFFDVCSTSLAFVRDHIEIFAMLIILTSLYEIYNRPSLEDIGKKIKKRLREFLP